MATRNDRRKLRPIFPRAVLPIGAVLMAAGPAPRMAQRRRARMWLNRVTYGINSVTLAEYQCRGRTAFLNELFEQGSPLAMTSCSPASCRDYPALNDYRAVLAGLFRPMWVCPLSGSTGCSEEWRRWTSNSSSD
jgi:hypothetical protein